jgi:hypothetical protein
MLAKHTQNLGVIIAIAILGIGPVMLSLFGSFALRRVLASGYN